MRASLQVVFALFICGQLYCQDLQLGVHVLPTSVIGDPAMFNITVRNSEEDVARGVVVQVKLHPGIEYKSYTPARLDFNPETGVWKVGEVHKYKAAVLGIIATVKSKEDAILEAEVAASATPDPDSTPGNGVDTNGNGKIIHDKGDEDDGDAAQNGPFN